MRAIHRAFRTVVAMLLLVGLAAMPLGTTAQPGDNGGPGNSGAAQQCKQGGWQSLVREDGSGFASQGECVSYGAEGGMLYPVAAVGCLNGGWQGVLDEQGAGFATQDECIGYVVQGGSLYSVTARACLDGRWQVLLRGDGSGFASVDACMDYAVQGGTLTSEVPVGVSGRASHEPGLTSCLFDFTFTNMVEGATYIVVIQRPDGSTYRSQEITDSGTKYRYTVKHQSGTYIGVAYATTGVLVGQSDPVTCPV